MSMERNTTCMEGPRRRHGSLGRVTLWPLVGSLVLGLAACGGGGGGGESNPNRAVVRIF